MLENYFNDLEAAVKNGVNLVVNGEAELFNIILFFVADLSFVKDVIGHCSSTSRYGCFHCKMPLSDWLTVERKTCQPTIVSQMVMDGIKGLEILGPSPKKDSGQFTKFRQ